MRKLLEERAAAAKRLQGADRRDRLAELCRRQAESGAKAAAELRQQLAAKERQLEAQSLAAAAAAGEAERVRQQLEERERELGRALADRAELEDTGGFGQGELLWSICAMVRLPAVPRPRGLVPSCVLAASLSGPDTASAAKSTCMTQHINPFARPAPPLFPCSGQPSQAGGGAQGPAEPRPSAAQHAGMTSAGARICRCLATSQASDAPAGLPSRLNNSTTSNRATASSHCKLLQYCESPPWLYWARQHLDAQARRSRDAAMSGGCMGRGRHGMQGRVAQRSLLSLPERG